MTPEWHHTQVWFSLRDELSTHGWVEAGGVYDKEDSHTKLCLDRSLICVFFTLGTHKCQSGWKGNVQRQKNSLKWSVMTVLLSPDCTQMTGLLFQHRTWWPGISLTALNALNITSSPYKDPESITAGITDINQRNKGRFFWKGRTQHHHYQRNLGAPAPTLWYWTAWNDNKCIKIN